jgi:hypothetical protein
MATDVTERVEGKGAMPAPRASDPSLSSLIGGIVDDAQKLIEKQIALLSHDIRKDVREAKETGMALAAGLGLLSVGGLFLLFMLAHLLEWAARPALELWVCYGIVGGAVALIGGVLYFRGTQKLDHLNVMPEQTAQGLKENLQWKTNPN